MKFLRFLVAICLLQGSSVLLAAQPSAPTSLVVTAEGHRLLVTGGSEGGEVAILGVSREVLLYDVRNGRYGGIVKDDGGGRFHLDIPRPVPADSVWAAVDVATGAYGVYSPKGPTGIIDFGRDWIKKDNNGQLKKFVVSRPVIDVLFVRPGEGVWESTAADGAVGDDDANLNGQTAVSPAVMRPRGKRTTSPEKFEKDDVLVVLDPLYVKLFITRVGEK